MSTRRLGLHCPRADLSRMRLETESRAAGVNTLGGFLVELTPSRVRRLKAISNTQTYFLARESLDAADYEGRQERHEQEHLRYSS